MAGASRKKAAVRREPEAPRAKVLGQPSDHPGRQVLRQWKIVTAIAATRHGLSAKQLAADPQLDLDCSERTLFRDLQQLADVGFLCAPENGGANWTCARPEGEASIPLPVLQEEVLALTLALAAVPRGRLQSDALGDLRSRLAARLTPEGRAWCENLAGAVSFSARAAFTARDSDILETLLRAIELEQTVRIRHRSGGREARDRVVEAYGIAHHPSGPYLVARCTESGEVKTFAVARIEEAEILDDTFDPDPEFDVRAWTGRSFGVFQGEAHRFVIEFQPDVGHVPYERTLHETQEIERLPDGRVRSTFVSTGLVEVAGFVAAFGGRARAIAPPELVEEVRRIHREGLEMAMRETDDPS